MNTPTYKEQFDKITRAYIRDEIRPWENCACFIGNMLNNTSAWAFYRTCNGSTLVPCRATDFDPLYYFYTMQEICDLENNFLNALNLRGDEESLFAAMDSTLDMLRKIHESKGEIIETFEFKKRELQPA